MTGVMKFSKVHIAVAFIVLIHIVCFVGVLLGYKEQIVHYIWLILLTNFILIIWTQSQKDWYFYTYLGICIAVGFIVEIIAVYTGLIFGEVSFGNTLGPKLLNVPVLIGFQWFVIIFTCANVIYHFYGDVLKRFNEHKILLEDSSQRFLIMGLVIDAALLSSFFDWLIEPVAQKLDFWHWNNDGSASIYNYICWFLVSCILHLFFFNAKFNIAKPNTFAINLFFIQALFFLALRFFLK